MGGPILRFYVGGDLLRYSCNVDWVTAYATAALTSRSGKEHCVKSSPARETGVEKRARELVAVASEPLGGAAALRGGVAAAATRA